MLVTSRLMLQDRAKSTLLTLGEGKLGRRAFWAGVGMGDGALSSGVCMLSRPALCCGRLRSGEGM